MKQFYSFMNDEGKQMTTLELTKDYFSTLSFGEMGVESKIEELCKSGFDVIYIEGIACTTREEIENEAKKYI